MTRITKILSLTALTVALSAGTVFAQSAVKPAACCKAANTPACCKLVNTTSQALPACCK